MEIREGETLYEKSGDVNIVHQYELDKQEIHIDKLEKQIADLSQQIEDIPEPKTKPDQETLDYYNEMIKDFDKAGLEEERDEKVTLLDIISGLK